MLSPSWTILSQTWSVISSLKSTLKWQKLLLSSSTPSVNSRLDVLTCLNCSSSYHFQERVGLHFSHQKPTFDLNNSITINLILAWCSTVCSLNFWTRIVYNVLTNCSVTFFVRIIPCVFQDASFFIRPSLVLMTLPAAAPFCRCLCLSPHYHLMSYKTSHLEDLAKGFFRQILHAFSSSLSRLLLNLKILVSLWIKFEGLNFWHFVKITLQIAFLDQKGNCKIILIISLRYFYSLMFKLLNICRGPPKARIIIRLFHWFQIRSFYVVVRTTARIVTKYGTNCAESSVFF